MGIKKYHSSLKSATTGVSYWDRLLAVKEKVPNGTSSKKGKPYIPPDTCPKCHMELTLRGECTNDCGYKKTGTER